MSETCSYDNLIAGDQRKIVNRPVTLGQGAGSLVRGCLLGRILRAIGDAGPDPGNTGEGTISGEAIGKKAIVGTYTATCYNIGTPALFEVVDPNGDRLDDAVADAAYSNDHLAFLITAYGTAFAVGDKFTIEVDAGSYKAKQASLTALDGSAEPFGILAEACDATAADVLTTCYVEGEFAESHVDYNGAETVADWRETCAEVGIYLRPTVA